MTFLPEGRSIREVKVPTQDGRWVKRTTGTRHKGTAEAMHRMVRDLGARGRRRWDLLGAVVDKRLTLGQLYDAYHTGQLEALAASLHDVDLSALVDTFAGEHYVGSRSGYGDLVVTRLRTLFPAGTPSPRTQLTPGAIQTWLARVNGSASTRRAYAMALSAFVRWLRRRGVLTANPMEQVQVPRANASRMRFLSTERAQQFVKAMPTDQLRAFAALAHAGGDFSAIIGVRESDRFDTVAGLAVRAPGTKAWNRDRFIVLEKWQQQHVQQWGKQVEQGAPLFEGLSYTMVRRAWRNAGEAIKETGYTLHDARHTYAVNALQEGLSVEAVATQLGHKDGTLVLKVYGRWIVRAVDYVRTKKPQGTVSGRANGRTKGAKKVTGVGIEPTTYGLKGRSEGASRTHENGPRTLKPSTRPRAK